MLVGNFSECICPPVGDEPELGDLMDPDTACPKGNKLAAEIKIENYGSFLVATSLNLRMSHLPALTAEEKKLPLFLVSDTIRVNNRIPKINNEVIAVSRNLIFGKNGKFEDVSQVKFITQEVEVYQNSPFEKDLERLDITTTLKASNELAVGLHQLLDFMEFISVSTDTFVTGSSTCPSFVDSGRDLDYLTPTFDWVREIAQSTDDIHLNWRSNILQNYRGKTLEGPLLNKELQRSEVEKLHLEQASVLEKEFGYLQDMIARESLTDLKQGEDIQSAVEATGELIRVGVKDETVNKIWAERLSIFSRIQRLAFLLADIENPKSINTEMFDDIPSFWPKEYDFEDFRYTINSMIRKEQKEWLLEVQHLWIRILRKIEHHYHVKNLIFDFKLNELLQSLRSVLNHKTIYQKKLSEWKEDTKYEKTHDFTATDVTIKIENVPVNKFSTGDFSQRFWISDRRFNNFAHLRVEDIGIRIEGLSDEDVMDHVKIVPLTSIIYDIGESNEMLVYTALPVEYPLADKDHAISPFTLWRFEPDNHLINKLKHKQTLHLEMDLSMKGVYVDGLTGREDDDCGKWDSNPEMFTDCKYGGSDAFYLHYDMVNVMHLDEINNLFALKYEHQISGEDVGMVTNITTDYSLPWDYGCTEIPNVGSYKIVYRIKVDASLGIPKLYFPPELPGFMELFYILNSAVVVTEKTTVDCNTDEEFPPEVVEESVTGNVTLTIALEKVVGEVSDEMVILDMLNNAVNSVGFGFEDPIKDDTFEKLLSIYFKEHFTAVELATIKYKPSFEPPKFVRPSKFFFQTVCDECTRSDHDDGYLITVYQTESANHADVQYPSDPHHTYGLDHAIPARTYTAGVFLGAHITFCDVYYPTYAESAAVDNMFTVTHEGSSNDNTPHRSELYIKYLTDMCIEFGDGFGNEGRINIYRDSFQFNSLTKHVRNHISNALSNQAEDAGRDFGNLIAGFEEFTFGCGYTGCTKWWEWVFLPWKCVGILLINCIFPGLFGASQDVFSDSTLSIFKTAENELVYQQECYSFKFPAMDFIPEVELTYDKENAMPKDHKIADNLKNHIQEATKKVLGLRFTESRSVSLFAAVNLLFPEQKVIEGAEFYSPGTIVMYGNVVGEYEEFPEFGPDCTPYDPDISR